MNMWRARRGVDAREARVHNRNSYSYRASLRCPAHHRDNTRTGIKGDGAFSLLNAPLTSVQYSMCVLQGIFYIAP